MWGLNNIEPRFFAIFDVAAAAAAFAASICARRSYSAETKAEEREDVLEIDLKNKSCTRNIWQTSITLQKQKQRY